MGCGMTAYMQSQGGCQSYAPSRGYPLCLGPCCSWGTCHPCAPPQGPALQLSFPECFHHSERKITGIVSTQERWGRSLAPIKTSFWRIPNRPWCFKMSFAFNPDGGRKITKEGSDPKWILLSSTWFILNVKVQVYKNKWIEWGICKFWSIAISPCLKYVLRYLLSTFCHCWNKRGTEAVEHCTQNDVKNKQVTLQGPKSKRGKGEKMWLVLSSCGPRTPGWKVFLTC